MWIGGVYLGFYFGNAGGDVECSVTFGGTDALDDICEGLLEDHPVLVLLKQMNSE